MKRTVETTAQYASFLDDVKSVILQTLEAGNSPEVALSAADSVLEVNTLWYPFNHIHEWNRQGLLDYAVLWHSRINFRLQEEQ
jgi:hypothetical protein